MFKVGDKVQNKDSRRPGIVTVSEVFGMWFNYEGATGDHAIGGGCYEHYWELVDTAPTSRTNDPATSKGKRKVNKYEEAVLSTLKGLYLGQGYTGKQIASLTGHPLNCITPRFAPLRRKNLIKDSGQRRDKQIVWVLA